MDNTRLFTFLIENELSNRRLSNLLSDALGKYSSYEANLIVSTLLMYEEDSVPSGLTKVLSRQEIITGLLFIRDKAYSTVNEINLGIIEEFVTISVMLFSDYEQLKAARLFY